MKIITILCAAVAFLALAPNSAHAGGRSYGYKSSHCVYKTHTCEVDRCRHKKMGYDSCGRCYTYWITVVTYRDYYSNGTSRTCNVTYQG
jgi:hypothetical protein